jgi:hypothetical protein
MKRTQAKAGTIWALVIIMLVTTAWGCSSPPPPKASPPKPTTTPQPTPPPAPQKTRAQSIPANAIKITPETDTLPPIMHSSEFNKPIPLGSGVNTAGAEDSAFVMPDGNTLYFFFTPDPNIPAEKQLFDGVTGIYISHKQGSQWSNAQRVMLVEKNEVALDGCVFVQGNEMWFCSARKGNTEGLDLWTAQFKNGNWTDWKNAGKKVNVDYEVGEMHITADGNEMYFHSPKVSGKGGYDIWVTRKVNGEWQPPENVAAVNTPDMEGWPFITQDGNELWFLRNYKGSPAIFRSKKVGGKWGTPELIVSQFAAEPSLDNAGNLYFTHHFYKDGKMLEADIYMAPRK